MPSPHRGGIWIVIAGLFFVAFAVVLAFLVDRPVAARATDARASKKSFASSPPSLATHDAFALPPAPRIAEAPPQAPGKLEGRVVSVEGGGIVDAELTFEYGGAASTVRSGADGHFWFQPDREGRFRLAAASAPGFWPFAPEWGASTISFVSRLGQAVQGFSVVLAPRRKRSGQVMDPHRQTVANAKVTVFDTGKEGMLYPVQGEFLSDAQGRFEYEAPDGAVLEARHPAFAPGRASVRSEMAVGGATGVTIYLGAKASESRETSMIAGVVVDPQGAPALGAWVTATAHAFPFVAEVDSEGRFKLEGVPPGNYRVVATAEDFVPATLTSVAAGAQNLRLQLQSGATVKGRVVDRSTQQPVAAFTVNLERKHGVLLSEVTRATAVLDANGEFELAGAEEGPHQLVVSAQGYAVSAPEAIHVPARGVAGPVTISLVRGGKVFGDVREEGTRKPLPGAAVSAETQLTAAASSVPVLVRTTTDATGKFELSGLGLGLRSIRVEKDGYHPRLISGLQIREQGNVGPLTLELANVKTGEKPELEMVGIGTVLVVQRDQIVIERVIPGGSAAEAGLLRGDILLRIDGVDVAALGFEGTVNHIRGIEGSQLLLRIRRGDVTFDQPVQRRKLRAG